MITVFCASLDHPAAQRPERLAVLDAAERTRAEKFRFVRDADRWRAARAALRECLGAECGIPAEQLSFRLKPNGKPFLSHSGAPAFNLSHSEGMALIAVGGDGPLGVDVETLRPVPEMVGVAESHFAPDERRALFALPPARRLDAFYRIWTRKEAYVKATGIGIGPALARFAVSLDVTNARLLRDDADPTAAQRWALRDLELDAPFVGALASSAPPSDISIRVWP